MCQRSKRKMCEVDGGVKMKKAEKLIIAIRELEFKLRIKSVTKPYSKNDEALEYVIKELKKILATCEINEQRNMSDESESESEFLKI